MTPINAPGPKRGELLRDPAGGVVEESGRTVVNAEGKDFMDGLARDQGHDEHTYTVSLGYNVPLGLVSIYTEPPNTPGAIAVRRYTKSNTLSFHLGGLFKKVPGLRVSSTQECTMTRGRDSKGREGVFISLKTTLDKVSGPSKKNGTKKNAPDRPAKQQDQSA